MAYYYTPHHVASISVRIDVLLSDGSVQCETVRFEADRDGVELTGQLADTLISAVHLAYAGRAKVSHG